MTIRFSSEASRREMTPVDNLFITDFLPDASAAQLKVYLYGLMQCRYPSMAEQSPADALGLTEEEVTQAFLYWQELRLVRILSDRPLVVEYEDVSRHTMQTATPAKYANLIASINRLTAPRQFGMRELAHVYDWVEVYGLDEGLIPELIGYCMDLKGRRVSINYISAVAQTWADDGIRTLEDAKARIEEQRLRATGAAQILHSWNKRRKPTQDELNLYEKWTKEWGFTEDAILAVLPRLTVTGSPNFTYLDEQLELMRQKGSTSLEAVQKEDAQDETIRTFSRMLFDRAGINKPATRIQCDQIAMFLNDYHMAPELMLYAAELSRSASEPFGLIKRKLGNWHTAGITAVPKAREYEEHQSRTASPQKPGRRGTSYAGNQVSQEDLDQLLKNFSEDI